MKKSIVFIIVSLCLINLVHASGQIDIAYSPYTITHPGSYTVVKDLTVVQDVDCISINTSNVTIDLNGHTLFGAGTTVGTTGSGIRDLGSYQVNNNVIVKNGNIDNFRSFGVYLSGTNCKVHDLNVKNCGSYGIDISNGVVENNDVSFCSSISSFYQIGCFYGSVINNRALSSPQGGGIRAGYAIIKDNVCTSNKLSGISAAQESIITGNHVESNQGDGISIDVGKMANVSNNICVSNSQNGINASFTFGQFSKNVCSYNGIAGINAYNLCDIRDNTINGNVIFGIACQNNCQVVGNMISYQTSSSGYGIYQNGLGSRIDSNHFSHNNYGIYFTSTTNWYGRNTFNSNSFDTGGTAPADPGSPYTNQHF